MKPKLLILSDMFGFDDSSFIKSYKESLESDFQLIFYDSSKLAEIDGTHLTENELHSQFINGGINSAVNKLLKLENKEVVVLAFSIGGTIAWKAALNGLKVKRLYAVSSTRLRNETKKPACSIDVIYGEEDPNKPESDWFKNLDLKAEIIKDGQHEIYKERVIITKLCERIKYFR